MSYNTKQNKISYICDRKLNSDNIGLKELMGKLKLRNEDKLTDKIPSVRNSVSIRSKYH
ncbi:MAG: hypothetical protein WBE61_10780 [Nitrososphaeraceae archaeon]